MHTLLDVSGRGRFTSLLLLLLTVVLAALVTFGQAATRSWTVDLGSTTSGRPGSLAGPGLPALPIRDLDIALPDGMRAVGLRVTPLDFAPAVLPDLTPVAAAVSSEGKSLATTAAVVGDAYPSDWGQLLGCSVWHGVSVAHVRLHALRLEGDGVRWTAATSLGRVRIELELAPLAGGHVEPRRLAAAAAARIGDDLRARVINPEDVVAPACVSDADKLQLSGGFAPTSLPTLDGSTVDYVIVTTEALASNFQALADYKTARGIPTVVRTVEWILENYHRGEDSPATIRTFLQDAYTLWGARFVLLGGDVELVPTRFIFNSLYPMDEGSDIPVDLYYGGLDSDWNADGDQTPGEPWSNSYDTGDAVDFAMELDVGRAPVKTAAEADLFVAKIIAYERDAVGSQYGNLLFMSEVLVPQDYSAGGVIEEDGANYSQETIDTVLADKSVQVTRYYETAPLWPGTLQETKSSVVAAMNTGNYGIVNHIGHGFFYVMSVGDRTLVLSDASTLTNAPNYFILNNLNCASAAFDYNSIMERFVTNPLGGAVLAIGSSRAAFPPPAGEFQTAFYDAVYNQRRPTAGEALSACRNVFVPESQQNTLERWTQMTLVMIGDPTLQLWTGAPEPLVVSAPATIGTGEQTVDVLVTRDGLPCVGARVCLSRTDDLYGLATTGADGYAHLRVLARSPGAAVLNVVAADSYPHTEVVDVDGGGQPFLSLAGLVVYDDGTYDSMGNGDGVLDAGETVAILATFRNSGDGDLAAYTQVDFTAGAPGVEPLVEACGVPPLAVGQTAQGDEPFLLVLDQGLADRTEIVCTLQTTDGGVTGRDEFPIEILAPVMEIGVITWNDFPYGNSNGIAEPNELIRVSFSLRNDGWGSTTGLTGWLETDTPGVTVTDSQGAWPDLTRKTELSQVDEFVLKMVSISEDRRAYLHIVDARGREWTHDFDLHGPAQVFLEAAWAPGPGMAELKWGVGSESDLEGYHVYRSLSPNYGYVRRTAIPLHGGFFVDDGLDPLTRYYFKVAPVDSSGMQGKLSSGWGVNTLPDELQPFPVAIGAETSCPVAVGDVDGDGSLDAVIAADGVYAWRNDGTELRDGDGNPATIGPLTAIGSDWSIAGVALADLTSSPGLEIVATCRTTKKVYVIEGDGDVAPGWPKTLVYWNWATPAVGDLDGDGDREVVVTDVRGRTYAWHHDGTEVLDGDADPATDGVFHHRPAEWYQYASPALADLDGDGAAEVLMPSRNTDGVTPDRIHAVNHLGQELAGWPYALGTWSPCICTPAVGDLDQDGELEIVLISENDKLHVVGADGLARPGFPLAFISNNTQLAVPCPSPALGDLDGDGRLDLVVVSVESAHVAKVYAYDLDGNVLAGWPREVPGNSESSPIVGDITGDGRPDVVFGIGGGTDSSPNSIYAFYHNGYDLPGFPLTLGGPIRSTPTLADFDGDGSTDLVYGGWDLALHVWELKQPWDPAFMPWPTFNGSADRSAYWELYDPTTAVLPSAAPAALALLGNRPNPFNPRTVIAYDLPAGFSGRTTLTIYDLAGRVVRRLVDGPQGEGRHEAVWSGEGDDGHALASGIYLYRLRAGSESATGRMALVR